MDPILADLDPETLKCANKFMAARALLNGAGKMFGKITSPFRGPKPAAPWNYASQTVPQASPGGAVWRGANAAANAVTKPFSMLGNFVRTPVGKGVMATGGMGAMGSMAAGGVAQLRQAQAGAHDYQTGIADGGATFAHQFSQLPWLQRQLFAVAPNQVLGSQGFKDQMYQHLQQNKDPNIQRYGRGIMNNLFQKLEGLRGGQNTPAALSARDANLLLLQQEQQQQQNTYQQMQELYRQMRKMQGMPPA